MYKYIITYKFQLLNFDFVYESSPSDFLCLIIKNWKMFFPFKIKEEKIKKKKKLATTYDS